MPRDTARKPIDASSELTCSQTFPTIADAFSLSYDLLGKTIDLETGEWLFISHKATKQRNVPIFDRSI